MVPQEDGLHGGPDREGGQPPPALGRPQSGRGGAPGGRQGSPHPLLEQCRPGGRQEEARALRGTHLAPTVGCVDSTSVLYKHIYVQL